MLHASRFVDWMFVLKDAVESYHMAARVEVTQHAYVKPAYYLQSNAMALGCPLSYRFHPFLMQHATYAEGVLRERRRRRLWTVTLERAHRR
jgi:hypothetical protein